MFSFNIGSVPVLFSKFFSAADASTVLAAIPERAKRVVFIDTASTPHLADVIQALLERDLEVHVRDHHDAPTRSNPRQIEIADAADRVRQLIGGNAVISNRDANPACSSLIEVGQFAGEGTVIVADPDADGLTATMKALGIIYPELDADAAVLDGDRAGQTAEKLSPNAYLFVRAMSTLPAFDPDRPQVSEGAKAKLFGDFVDVVQGDAEAKSRLQKGVETYELGVHEAKNLAEAVVEVIPGLFFVDVTTAPRFDMGTLAAIMERRPGCKVTVQRKTMGPIAAKHGGIQISLAVARAHQAALNLQELLPAGFISSPESGIISNTPFLLHVSESVWRETVLPALKAKLAS